MYSQCSCVQNTTENTKNISSDIYAEQVVISGNCPVDCKTAFALFLLVICLTQLIGATGKTSNFLVAVR